MRRKNTSTEFLKECMSDALFRLLQEKPLDEITITEITDLADVGRVTFYRNFSKKEDLITYKLSLLKEQFFESFPVSAESYSRTTGRYLFSFIYDTRDILNTLYHAGILNSSLLYLSENISKRNADNPAKRFQNSFLSFGILGIVISWIQDGFQETPDELVELLEQVRKQK